MWWVVLVSGECVVVGGWMDGWNHQSGDETTEHCDDRRCARPLKNTTPRALVLKAMAPIPSTFEKLLTLKSQANGGHRAAGGASSRVARCCYSARIIQGTMQSGSTSPVPKSASRSVQRTPGSRRELSGPPPQQRPFSQSASRPPRRLSARLRAVACAPIFGALWVVARWFPQAHVRSSGWKAGPLQCLCHPVPASCRGRGPGGAGSARPFAVCARVQMTLWLPGATRGLARPPPAADSTESQQGPLQTLFTTPGGACAST